MPRATARGNITLRQSRPASIGTGVTVSLSAMCLWAVHGIERLRRRRAERQARAWLLQLTSGRATTDDARAFRQWCHQATRHRIAFARTRDQWMRLNAAAGSRLTVPPHTVSHDDRCPPADADC
ncbi:protein of unknown function [Dyella jiangningensis]|nr:uncharacterized protein DUF4880 [Dyella sp. AtDHG13]SDK49645.1 protein of unknown function [Dyella jiangningensis]